MSWKRRPALAGLTMVLVTVLVACGGGADKGSSAHAGPAKGEDSSAAQREDRPVEIAGVRDSVRHVTRRTTKGTRPHLVKKCATDTRKVKHTRRSKGRTKTWYSTERHQDCKKVRKGTETYTRVVRQERWCVRLDDVNGKPAKDDVWYRVRPATYSEVNEADARAKVTFEPIEQGC
ncbi:hypothetical protein OKJ48_35645 [Streptomyces kunmingensis]|uniref:Lipoprotein n=1 Tax=Streptomyces kunmingensis TaxID=68225 RepID=A0ABU6CM42_9ACTN|nr:hypothetical protein [Streptomyces kunmingensis]MEB3965524.1 hypothetical protein [Streptomyces kunmingensis]